SKRDEALDVGEHAALSAVCLAILNLDEALTRECVDPVSESSEMRIDRMNELHRENMARVTRRQLFGSAASGVGMAALASRLDKTLARGAERPSGETGLPGLPHFTPRAKRVVVLWQGGGPSHVDLFDPKPVMQATAGKDIPDSVRGTTRLSTMSSGYGQWPTLPAIKPFKKYGQAGI